MLRNLGPLELILIVAIIALLFGGKKIPELMRGLGTGLKEFKKAAQGDEEHKPDSKTEDEKKN